MKMNRFVKGRLALVFFSGLLSACSANQPSVWNNSTKDTAVSNIPKTFDIKTTVAAPANAPLVKAGQTATVHYTGWVLGKSKEESFDSSKKRGVPFSFKVGGRQVIRGWDEGLQQMAVGGTYEITLAPEYGYGASGAGSLIPPHATLVFEIEVLSVK